MALEILRKSLLPIADYRSKSWDEFAAPGAPRLDFVFTVCDNAAGEVCPAWPGQPMTAHWGIEDPAAIDGEGQERAFQNAFFYLQRRIRLFLALPIESIDKLSLQHKLQEIGKTRDAEQPVG
jgi:protein-tyrosine-phosphatase